MRIDPDNCRDPDLLAAEVRRLQGVISASNPTLTDDEREAVNWAANRLEDEDENHEDNFDAEASSVLFGLLERLSPTATTSGEEMAMSDEKNAAEPSGVSGVFDFVAFAKHRAITGSRCFRSNCGHCGQEMRVSLETLKKEWLECKPTCECGGGGAGSYGGSPQESHDIAYHGGRFHSAEW